MSYSVLRSILPNNIEWGDYRTWIAILIGVIIIVILTMISRWLYGLRFVIRDWELLIIRQKKEFHVCSVSLVTDIYVEWYEVDNVLSNILIYGPINPANAPQFKLVLYAWEKVIHQFSHDNFPSSWVRKLIKTLKSFNPSIKYTSYRRNTFWDIFPFYRNRKR